MMRYGSRPFVVEVKRGQKRSSVVQAVEPLTQPLPPQAQPENSLDEIFRRAEAALFDRSGGENGAAAPTSATSVSQDGSSRRILENLTEVDPLEALIAERGETSRRGRKPGSKNKPKDVVALEAEKAETAKRTGSVELTPERINEALKAMERATGAFATRKPGVPTTSDAAPPRPIVPVRRPHVIVEEPRAAAKIRPAVAAKLAEPLAVEAAVAMDVGAVMLEPVASTVAEPRNRDRGTIRGRYVTNTETRPGERWKRRLRGVL